MQNQKSIRQRVKDDIGINGLSMIMQIYTDNNVFAFES